MKTKNIKQTWVVLLVGFFVFGFKGNAFAQEAKVEAKVEKKTEEKDADDKRYNLSWGLTNTVGAGTFVSENSNPTLINSLKLGGSYKVSEKETMALSMGWAGELFTQSDSAGTDYVYMSDPSISVSTGRIPQVEINEDLKISFGASLSLRPGLSLASRKVTKRIMGSGLGLSASTGYSGFSFAVAPSFSYNFNRYTALSSDLGRSAYDGTLNTRLSLGNSYSFGYSYDKLSAGISLGHSHSRTEENNDGNAYWRNGVSFGVNSGYALHQYLKMSLGLSTSMNPYNKKGEFRVPFWAPFQKDYVDYYSASSIYLSMSGSY